MITRCLMLALVSISSLTALPAYAHHPLGGDTPETMLHGLLSGIGHPLLGLTHMLFMVAIGLLFALQPGATTSRVLLFLGATCVGALVHVLGLDIPAVEQMMALGVAIAGLMLAWRQLAILPGVLALACIAGLLHGFAYAEDIIGARTGPLVSYFVGFVLIQGVILSGIVWAARKQLTVRTARLIRRWELGVGGLVAGLGVLLLSF